MPKPTIVLVHGAWADASSWNAVAAGLHYVISLRRFNKSDN